jgi:membrane-bound ClpP family serine protease
MKPAVENSIKNLLTERLILLESHFQADFLVYYGPIVDGNENVFLKIVEDIATDPQKKDKIYVMLTTTGGSAIAVERYVNILRHHYNEVNFIIPDCAYSAGTIFCMSGDNILMDYFSVLGPIDPQVQNKDGKWVAALGYLDKVNELIEKARSKDPDNQLTQAEFLILKDIDLAELRGYEQAKNLTIELLKKWLVKYKFKNWTEHKTDPALLGTEVTLKQKEVRAKEIADKLSDSNLWKSHGRPINIETLEKVRLIIEDYSKEKYRKLIRQHYDLFFDFVTKSGHSIFIQTRKFI